MVDEQLKTALRARARELIRDGLLPTTRSAQLSGGEGSGATCSLCGQIIEPAELEIELRVGKPSAVHYFFHAPCHSAWEQECLAAQP